MPRRRIPMNINANAIPAPWDGNHEDVPEGPPNAQARNMANNFGLEDANGVEARPPSRDYISRIDIFMSIISLYYFINFNFYIFSLVLFSCTTAFMNINKRIMLICLRYR